MDTAIQARLERLYVAIGRSVEKNMAKRPASVGRSSKAVFMYQDFSGGQSEAEQSETLHSLIGNVASFHDHFKAWALRHGTSENDVHRFFLNSPDFCIVVDLWNHDKHGEYPQRKDGWSRLAPRLSNIRSVCQLRTQAKEGSWVGMQSDLSGKSTVNGDGAAEVLVTADVLDKNGNGIGQAHDIIQRSIKVCEAALQHFGVN